MPHLALRRWLCLAVFAWVTRLDAAPRLDAFPGYSSGGYARLGSYFPLAIELQGDGPTVTGYLEVSTPGSGGTAVRFPMELPSNTTKRVILPLFASAGNATTISVRLVTEAGKLVAERSGASLVTLAPESVLVGTLPGQAQNAPIFPERPGSQVTSDVRPVMVRMDPGLFPDTPVALEGLNALYLHSRRALELKEPQYAAIQSWVASGGHVIVAIENSTDVTATEWLRRLLPARVSGVVTKPAAGVFQRFLAADPGTGPGNAELQYGTQPTRRHLRRNNSGSDNPFAQLIVDSDFERQQVTAVGLTPAAEAVTFLAVDKTPLAVSGRFGRGLVTVLAFNPEQEPFRSWKLRGWFFARLASVPGELLSTERLSLWGGRGIDTVFGSMIETRQIRKLPVGVLLLLLLVYLVVIGPFDQWWLKKIHRPMLTWITFPAYVALFSLLIYFIGFKLRSGQSEYSELQVVDVLPRGTSGDAALRGRTFASIYSPANNTYKLKSELPAATLRGEFRSGYGVNNDAGHLELALETQGFQAAAYVPVWTAQSYVSDWTHDGDAPLTARWAGGRLTIKSGGKRFDHIVVIQAGQWHELGPLGAGGEVNFAARPGESLDQLVSHWEPIFTANAQRRETTFGDSTKEHINEPDWAQAVIAASFCGGLAANDTEQQRDWMWSNGFDLTPNRLRGDTVLFAWMANDTAVARLNQFTALRGTKSAMYRLVIPKTADTPEN